MQSPRTVARSVATSLVALLLLAGAVYATSDLVTGGRQSPDSVPTSAERSADAPMWASPEPSESAEPAASPRASGSAEPSESAEPAASLGPAHSAVSNHDSAQQGDKDEDGDVQGANGDHANGSPNPTHATGPVPAAGVKSWGSSHDGGNQPGGDGGNDGGGDH